MAYEEVRQLNHDAIGLAKAGHYDEAHRALAQALLPRDPNNVEVTELNADTRRNDGFTYTREAAKSSHVDHQQQLLHSAELGLAAALSDVDRLIVRDDWAREQGHGLRTLPDADKASLHANWAATMGVMARTVTVRAVLDASAHHGRLQDRGSHTRARQAYTDAYTHAALGNNGYYRTSIAITAAQHEIMFGSYANVCKWLGRTAASVLWTYRHDRRNFKPARETASARFALLGELAINRRALLDRP